ncbi:aminotransferase-like domain-containing protein [Arcticibacter eurypsychrophilus]|uniref:hypothetical protein n=1 Tax=Arcticibacter eurypsychrophilus TaxID=1434752 RepID=UPI00084D4356|nr:hypothetical protein [Arcticibacter eurypsychrophilus]
MDFVLSEAFPQRADGQKWNCSTITESLTVYQQKLSGNNLVQVPTYRDLASYLGISSRTVNPAYKELRNRSILFANGTRGTYFVPGHVEKESRINPFLDSGTAFQGYIPLNLTLPLGAFDQQMVVLEMDLSPLPLQMVHRLCMIQQGILRKQQFRSLSCEESMHALKKNLLQRLKDQGLPTGYANLLPVSQGRGLDAVADVLLQPGDLVVMESMSDHYPLNVFHRIGCEIACTGHQKGKGMDMQALRKICEAQDVRVVFIRPDSSCVHGIITDDESRNTLIALACEFNFRIIAYEVESEFVLDYLPERLSLKAHKGRVIFISVLSKVNQIWENINYVVAERCFIDVLKTYVALLPGHQTYEIEHAAAWLLSTGELDRHIKKQATSLKRHMKQMYIRLNTALKTYAYVEKPDCGRFITIHFKEKRDMSTVITQLKDLRIYAVGRNAHLNQQKGISGLRIEFSRYKEADCDRLIKCLLPFIALKEVSIFS